MEPLKRGEIYCQAFGLSVHALSVRFGNVFASEGSVVPIFMDQIVEEGLLPLPILI
jgi:FlaA1/EpsC-like NDP-sugar epimerase